MTLETLRAICRALPGVTEDIKWGADLAFSVGGKMFCVANTEPPFQMSFKCTAEGFAELVEREGLIPAPYLARAMWVQQSALADEALDRQELERLLRTSYELVVAKLPKSKRPGAKAPAPARSTKRATTRAKTKTPAKKAQTTARPRTKKRVGTRAKKRVKPRAAKRSR